MHLSCSIFFFLTELGQWRTHFLLSIVSIYIAVCLKVTYVLIYVMWFNLNCSSFCRVSHGQVVLKYSLSSSFWCISVLWNMFSIHLWCNIHDICTPFPCKWK
jgi:hypothetical protein